MSKDKLVAFYNFNGIVLFKRIKNADDENMKEVSFDKGVGRNDSSNNK